MAMIKKQEAVERLVQSVRVASADDLAEIYNELFPDAPTTEEQVKANASALAKKVTFHIAKGLEVEEILDLWNVVFPAHRSVWFDEDAGLMHYDDKIEHAGLLDG